MIADQPPPAPARDPQEIAKYSQREVDLLDLKANELTTVPLDELIAGRDSTPATSS